MTILIKFFFNNRLFSELYNLFQSKTWSVIEICKYYRTTNFQLMDIQYSKMKDIKICIKFNVLIAKILNKFDFEVLNEKPKTKT